MRAGLRTTAIRVLASVVASAGCLVLLAALPLVAIGFLLGGDERDGYTFFTTVSVVGDAGDVDGDGHDDVYTIVGSGLREGREMGGLARVHSGRTGQVLFELRTDEFVPGGEGFGRIGDIDGDGIDDFLLTGLRYGSTTVKDTAFYRVLSLANGDPRVLVEAPIDAWRQVRIEPTPLLRGRSGLVLGRQPARLVDPLDPERILAWQEDGAWVEADASRRAVDREQDTSPDVRFGSMRRPDEAQLAENAEDYDGDGRRDVVVERHDVVEVQGSGGEVVVSITADGLGFSIIDRALTVADLDGDDVPELLIAGRIDVRESPSDRPLHEHGVVVVSPVTREVVVPLGERLTEAPLAEGVGRIGDVDADGVLDLSVPHRLDEGGLRCTLLSGRTLESLGVLVSMRDWGPR